MNSLFFRSIWVKGCFAILLVVVCRCSAAWRCHAVCSHPKLSGRDVKCPIPSLGSSTCPSVHGRRNLVGFGDVWVSRSHGVPPRRKETVVWSCSLVWDVRGWRRLKAVVILQARWKNAVAWSCTDPIQWHVFLSSSCPLRQWAPLKK